jgi:hypothetical protein
MPTRKSKKPEKLPKGEVGGEDRLVTLWRRRIELAHRIRRKKAGEEPTKSGPWYSLMRFYEGEQWGADDPSKDNYRKYHRITLNKAKSNIDSIRPHLYFKDPKVKLSIENPALAPDDIFDPEIDPQTGEPIIDPQTGEMVPKMQPVTDPNTGQPAIDPMTGQPQMQPVIMMKKGTPMAVVGGEVVDAQEQVNLFEGIDNYFVPKCKVKKTAKRNINDACVLPFGVSKWSWVIETAKVMQKDGTEKEEIVKQYPKYDRVKPWCFFWDNEIDELDLDKANWVFEERYMSQQDVEEEFPEANISKADWSEIGDPRNYVDDHEATVSQSGRMDDDRKRDMGRYKLYEIHDLRNGELLFWLDGMKKMLRHQNPNPYEDVEGSIYTELHFDETPREAMPLAMLDQIKSLNEGLNYAVSYQLNHAERLNRKYKVRKGGFATKEDKTRWERGGDGTTVEMTDMVSGPDPVPDIPAPSDSYAVKQILEGAISEGMAVTAQARGQREPGVNTATEASYLQGGMDIKLEEKRDTVKDYMTLVVRKLNVILKLYATKEQAIKIKGPAGEKWLRWSKDDIQGEFLEEIDIYSGQPFAELEDRKQAMEFYSIAAEDIYWDPFKVRQYVAKRMNYPEDLMRSPEEVQMIMQQQAQAQQEQAAANENRKQQGSTLRPSGGEVRRKSDMRGEILGGARSK